MIHKQAGFTIIEISLILAALALIFAGGLVIGQKWTTQHPARSPASVAPEKTESLPTASPQQADDSTSLNTPTLPLEARSPEQKSSRTEKPSGQLPSDLKPAEVCLHFTDMDMVRLSPTTVKYDPSQKTLIFAVENRGQTEIVGLRIEISGKISFDYDDQDFDVIVEGQNLRYSLLAFSGQIDKYSNARIPHGSTFEGTLKTQFPPLPGIEAYVAFKDFRLTFTPLVSYQNSVFPCYIHTGSGSFNQYSKESI